MAKIKFTCEFCNKYFLEYKSNRVKKHVFCSKNCADRGKMVDVIPWNKGFGKYMENEKNPAWKGNNVGYTALHDWVKQRLGKAMECVACSSDRLVGWANISHKYTRDISDWAALCKKCHFTYDKGENWGKGRRAFA